MKNKLIITMMIFNIFFGIAGIHVNAQNDAFEILKLINQLKSDNFSISLQAQAPLVEYGDAAVLNLKRMMLADSNVWNRIKQLLF